MSDDTYAEPRNECSGYFIKKNIATPIKMSKADFDAAMDTPGFFDGPFLDNFGSGYGEPYNPVRQAFGILKDGRGVFMNPWEATP